MKTSTELYNWSKMILGTIAILLMSYGVVKACCVVQQNPCPQYWPGNGGSTCPLIDDTDTYDTTYQSEEAGQQSCPEIQADACIYQCGTEPEYYGDTYGYSGTKCPQ